MLHSLTNPRRIFAVIPAAGHSRRMGQPKLLLRFGGQTVIAMMLRSLKITEIATTFVVIRKDDEPLRVAASSEGATVIQPATDPPDMRTSVTEALAAINKSWHPAPNDGWLLSPADHPCLDHDLIRTLAAQWQHTSAPILAPIHAGRRGHPTIFAWHLVSQLAEIPADRGLNWLVETNPVAELSVENAAILEDLDTPEDYARLQLRGKKLGSDRS